MIRLAIKNAISDHYSLSGSPFWTGGGCSQNGRPDSIASVICAREVEHAVTCKKRLIPIVVRDVDHTLVNPVLASLNWIFFREYDDLADSFNKLVGALDTNLEYFHAGSRLLVRAREWESRGHNASFTLRGSDLNEAERWLVKGTEQKQGPTAL